MSSDKEKLIRAYPLEQFFENKANSWRGTFSGPAYMTALEQVKAAPAVDAVEVVHGRWIQKIDMVSSYLSDCEEMFSECSVCHSAEISGSNYCPNCGAKMDGEKITDD